jgi:hypothetical protein
MKQISSTAPRISKRVEPTGYVVQRPARIRRLGRLGSAEAVRIGAVRPTKWREPFKGLRGERESIHDLLPRIIAEIGAEGGRSNNRHHAIGRGPGTLGVEGDREAPNIKTTAIDRDPRNSGRPKSLMRQLLKGTERGVRVGQVFFHEGWC